MVSVIRPWNVDINIIDLSILIHINHSGLAGMREKIELYK